jgi:hypothetical protein
MTELDVNEGDDMDYQHELDVLDELEEESKETPMNRLRNN